MKILLLSRYNKLGASSRLRFFQYLPYLRENGYEIDISSLLDDSYVEKLYNSQKIDITSVCISYIKRAKQLLSHRKYDLLWIEKELFPWVPAIAELILSNSNTPYVVDFDDAIFHRYDQHPNIIVRSLFKNKIDSVMRHASLVVAGNEYLLSRAKSAGAKNIEYLPTVIDISRYKNLNKTKNKKFTIGWIGTQGTSKYLDLVMAPLIELKNINAVEFVAIGPNSLKNYSVPWEIINWTEDTEVANISSFDVGIMPLDDGLWEKGKCAYKIIQYMACGLPVVASNVGANKNIVEHGENGFLASTKDEWLVALNTLINMPEAAIKMGTTGRIKVEKELCLQVTAPKLMKFLEQAVKRNY